MYFNCRATHDGGATLHISECFNFTVVYEFSKVGTFIECFGVQTNMMNKKTILLCIYESPSGNIENFFYAQSELLSLAHDKTYSRILVFGDFNLDLFKCPDTNVQGLRNLINSFSLFPLVTKHIRMNGTTASLIGLIWAT